MPRLLLLLLALLLPLQSVWAVATTYCQHETSVSQKRHFGHHEHVHATLSEVAVTSVEAADTPSDSHRSVKLPAHGDCGVCHAVSASTLLPSAAPLHAAAPAEMPGLSMAPHSSSAPQRAPDRPQWIHLA